MRIGMLVLVSALVLFGFGCAQPQVRDTAPTPTSVEATAPPAIAVLHGDPAQDALLQAASKLTASTPVRIVGYEVVMWQDDELDFEVFVTKSGELMTPSRKWGADPTFAPLEERPPARVTPVSDEEERAEQNVITSMLERSETENWGSDEAMVRIYLLEDADGERYLMSPDGAATAPAPALEPWS